MNNPFKYLRDAEWLSLLKDAQHKQFGPDETLLEEGRKPSGIFIVQSGEVKVCRNHSGFMIELAAAGPGTIFGEMSFIESEPANANVVTKSDVEILFITHDHVQAIIRENPGFFGRFFQSLAYILSQRLRETTGQVTGKPGGETTDVWKEND